VSGERDRREVLRFTLPALPAPSEERLPTDVPQLAILYKLLKEIRSVTELLEELVKSLRAKGEVLPLTVEVESGEISPGYGLWRSVSVHNLGPADCRVRLNRWDAPPALVRAGESRSWGFLTPAVSSLCVECSGKSALELEFLR